MTASLIVRPFGAHGNRTPFAYMNYQRLLMNYGVSVDFESDSPDFLVTGFHVDIVENKLLIESLKKNNPKLKLLVLSEEPLWDITWNKDVFQRKLNCNYTGYEYYYLNHFNSDIFSFGVIPYFLTTDIKYVSRYNLLLSKLIDVSVTDIYKSLVNSRYVLSAFLERRVKADYVLKRENGQLVGLSVYRSDMVEAAISSDSFAMQVEGKGWGSHFGRTKITDWHADKLAKLNRSSKFTMSIENTVAESYVSEKPFDALVSCSIPVVAREQVDNLNKFFDVSAFLIVDSVEDFPQRLQEFSIDSEFLQIFCQQIHHLYALFRNKYNYLDSLSLYSRNISNSLKEIF